MSVWKMFLLNVLFLSKTLHYERFSGESGWGHPKVAETVEPFHLLAPYPEPPHQLVHYENHFISLNIGRLFTEGARRELVGREPGQVSKSGNEP